MNLDQFEEYLDGDLSWRKIEISDLLLLAKEKEKDVLLKSLILLIYAHWEGYIKKSSKLYLKYVKELNLQVDKLSPNFMAIVLKSQVSQCLSLSEKLTMSSELAFIDSYNIKKNRKFSVSVNPDNDFEKDVIDTQSNLKPKILKSIHKILGLEYTNPLIIREQYLNANLLANRNIIGHGSPFNTDHCDDFNLSIEDVEKLKNIVFTIIDNFRDELVTYAEQEYYLIDKQEVKMDYDILNEEQLENDLNHFE